MKTMRKSDILVLLFTLIVAFSCENEPIGEAIINNDSFDVDSELYLLMERVSEDEAGEEPLECIDFSYPFALFIFDETGQYVAPTSIESDEEFSALLGSLVADYSVSINYPITGTTTTGDLVEINTNDELKELIDECVRVEIERNCNNTINECIWQVAQTDNFPNEYEGQYLFVNENDILQLHSKNNIYFGAWIGFYIGYDLHLNITFVAEDESEIDTYWNEDWKVITFTDNIIDIESGEKRIRIEKKCNDLCDGLIYEECEIEDTPGFFNFELNNYSVCTSIPATHDFGSPLVLSYFENEIDAQAHQNEISGTDYLNIENPQTIFMRIELQETEELMEIAQFEIGVIQCN